MKTPSQNSELKLQFKTPNQTSKSLQPKPLSQKISSEKTSREKTSESKRDAKTSNQIFEPNLQVKSPIQNFQVKLPGQIFNSKLPSETS